MSAILPLARKKGINMLLNPYPSYRGYLGRANGFTSFTSIPLACAIGNENDKHG
jgi:hypothetical protein